MAFAFPLTLAQFHDGLPISQEVFSLTESVQVSENAGGEVLQSQYGPRLWEGSTTVMTHSRINADALVAMVELLRQPGGAFLISPRHLTGPFADQSGAILGAATPTFTTVNANLRDVNIGGLPSFYVISVGDFVGFQYGSSPVRYALHRFVKGGTANVSGGISGAEVSPPMRPGVVNGQAITLVKPVCKAVVLPASFAPQQHGFRPRGSYSFSWRQTLR
jgi:hypothetical protein